MLRGFLASGKDMAMINTGIGLTMLFALSSLAAEKPLTVCEILSNLDTYRGKMITIRGVMIGGHRHGWTLYDYDQGQNGCPDVLKRGLRWPSSISLSWPTDPNPEDGPIIFQPDLGMIERSLAKIQKIQGSDDVWIIATIHGELRARNDIVIFHGDDGSYYGSGYGPGGQDPAQLMIERVSDLQSVPREEWRPRKEN